MYHDSFCAVQIKNMPIQLHQLSECASPTKQNAKQNAKRSRMRMSQSQADIAECLAGLEPMSEPDDPKLSTGEETPSKNQEPIVQKTVPVVRPEKKRKMSTE